MQRENQGKIGSLQRQQGGYTNTEKETLDLLLETHFPGCVTTTQNSNDRIEDIPISRASREDWKQASRIINITRLEWAINSFEPYKSPGVDGIFPALLKQGMSKLATPLCALLRASLALGYVPIGWRKVKVVFIPKPGRDTYAQAKSFRPISLTSFLLKTLEKLIDRHIRDDVLSIKPLHRNQYAYQAGKSCELAIHELTHRIERALDSRETAIGTFLDIEGAFDNTSFDSISRAVKRRGVGQSIVRWIDSALRTRNIQTMLGSTSEEVSATRGCPQGGGLITPSVVSRGG